MAENPFKYFEYLLPYNDFYRNSEIVHEYGSSYETFILNSVLVKNPDLFKKYQTEDLITITTQSGTKSVSRKLLIDLISTEGLYKYVITNLDNELSLGARLDYFVDGSINGSIQIGRADLSLFLKQLDITSLNPQQRMRIALITNITSLFSLEKKYENAIHSANIDGKLYSVPASLLISLLTMCDEEFTNYINREDNLYEYSKPEMVYLLINFININRILEKYVFPPKVLERYKALESQSIIDYESLNKNLKTNDNDLDGESIVDKVSIDEAFLSEIFAYQKNTYSNLEMSIYIYIRLCELLTYDQGFYANSRDSQEQDKHSSLESIRNINLENNDVTHYEFFLIFAHLLKRLGIRYTLDNRILSGNFEGCSITFREAEYLIEANAIQDIIYNDMTNAKINSPLSGLRCINKSEVSRRKFEEIYYKVMKDIKETKANKEEFATSLQAYHDKYAKTDLPFKDKLYVLLKDIARPDLKGIDAISYQKRIFDNLFKDNENIKINFVSSTINPYRGCTLTPLTIISFLSDDKYHYYMIDPNNPELIMNVSKEEIEELFESRDLAYINSRDDIIMGLVQKEGVSYVR